jgi:molybdate transport system substrate-binding protein
MARRLPASLTAAALLLVSVAASLAGSSPITVLSSNGLRAVLAAAAPQFEHASGNQLAIQYSVSSELKKRIESGEPFDVAIVTPPVIDGLIARGTIAANTRTEVARSGFGIAVRRGARKPDLRTVDAMKTALLSAKSIAFATEGAGGLFFTALVNTLGLSERLSPKFKPTVTGVDVSEAVASGAADLGVQPISEILFVPGVELAGGFPAAVQGYSVMVAGISTASKHGDAAKALIAFLTSSALEPELKRRGMERVPQARSDRHTRAPSARNGPS